MSQDLQQKLEDVEATLAKAETKRDSADEAGDKDKYAKYDREVTRLSSSVDALNIRIAAEKQAGNGNGGWTEEDRKGIRIMTRLAPCFEEELMDCWKTCFRTTTKQKSFKEALADYYNCRIKGHTNKLKCMLTGLQLPYDFLAAAHIWKKAKGGSGMFELFRLKPSDADDPRNGLLLARRIEEAFDRKDVCFLYSPPKQQLTLYVVNMDGNTATRRNPLRTTTVAQVKGWKSDQKKLAPTFEDLHGRPLLLPDGILIPFRRILSLHAKFAFQYGKNNGFISQEEFEQFETYSRVSDDAILREASSNL